MCARRMTAILCCALLAACATVRSNSEVDSLVAAENAFAAMGAAQGVRASFLANFADDGVVFTPKPVPLRETWSARPPPADPLAQQLLWKPAAAAVARSGEIGMTTGPSSFSIVGSGKPPSYGIFTSVWRRDIGGRWQVVLDVGVSTPAPVAAETLAPAPALFAAGADSPSPAAVERALRGAGNGGFAAWIADDARWYRDGQMPVLRGDDFARLLTVAAPALDITPEAELIAASQDFAFTYGTLRMSERDEVRNYVHLWTRDAAGHWRIVVAVWP